jgi:hypothetical protein
MQKTWEQKKLLYKVTKRLLIEYFGLNRSDMRRQIDQINHFVFLTSRASTIYLAAAACF